MSTHTPGPWFPWWNDHYWEANTHNDRYAPSVAAIWASGNIADAAEANARLIAAAPEMLQALKGALVIIESSLVPEGMSSDLQQAYAKRRDAIHAAIAKAEGRQ